MQSIIKIGLCAFLGVAFVGLQFLRYKSRRKLICTWAALKPVNNNQFFNEKMVSGLPEPARRYFLHALKPGARVAQAAYLTMNGYIRVKPGGEWMPFESEEMLNPSKGFVWKAVTRNKLKLSGSDMYYNGEGNTNFWLWKIIPVVNSGGDNIAKSAIGRVAAESVLVPSALLPGQGVTWTAVNHNQAKANITLDGVTHELTCKIGEEGNLVQASLLRWCKNHHGQHEYIPFGVEVVEEKEFHGLIIPSKIVVGWWFGTDKFDMGKFFKVTIEHVEFE